VGELRPAVRIARPGYTFPVRHLIAPSLLAADFSRLGEEVAKVEPSVDMLHLDVMDGHFVPNISFGFPVIAALRPLSALPFDCHIMTSNPGAYLDELAQVGADLVTVHLEAATDPTGLATGIRRRGIRFGLAISPPTPWGALEPFVELCDQILVMAVHPGFGGQVFIPEVLAKVAAARKWIDSHGFSTDIEIDGGIDVTNIGRVCDAGANVFVAGTAVFGAEDPTVAVAELRQAIEGAADE
jgi:ribulose-phosphate 3-epimerase